MKEKDFKSKYKNFFNSLELNSKEKNLILNNILNANKKQRFVLKPSMTLLIIIISLCIGFTVYATANSELFNTLIVKYKERKDGKKDATLSSEAIKEINYQADISQFDDNGKYKIYSLNELEKKLGIKTLKSNKLDNQKIYISAIEKDKNNNIGYIRINHKKTTTVNNSFTVGWFMIHITTKYAEIKKNNDEPNLVWSHDAKEILIKNLNTIAMVSNDSNNAFRCRFDYDNIKYNILITFRNSNKLTEDEKLKMISDFFETISY